MTTTRQRVLGALAVPAVLVLLAACGTDDGTTTTTSAAAATTSTATGTDDAQATATTPAAGEDQTATTTAATTAPEATRTAAAGLPGSFSAFGTEPFWDVQVSGETLTFSGVDLPTRVMESERTDAGSSSTFTGDHEGTSYTLTVREGDCSDGMSDDTHPFTSTFVFGTTTYQGCGK